MKIPDLGLEFRFEVLWVSLINGLLLFYYEP